MATFPLLFLPFLPMGAVDGHQCARDLLELQRGL